MCADAARLYLSRDLDLFACQPRQVLARLGTARANRPAKALSATVVAVIPARNEADTIEQTVRSLLSAGRQPRLKIIVVDDNSDDGTGELACRAALSVGKQERVAVLRGSELPAGWTGKMWAVAQGVAEAEKLTPDYLLLTDADIRAQSE